MIKIRTDKEDGRRLQTDRSRLRDGRAQWTPERIANGGRMVDKKRRLLMAQIVGLVVSDGWKKTNQLSASIKAGLTLTSLRR